MNTQFLQQIIKVVATTLALTFIFASVSAQSNPKPGYIITNQSDTLRGQIDDRLASMNVRRCSFCPEGETVYREYLPGEIRAYYLEPSAEMYETCSAPIGQTDSTFFAICLVKGNMSLYRLPQSFQKEDLYIFRNACGEVAVLDPSFESNTTINNHTLRRRNLSPVIQLGRESEAWQNALWHSYTNSDNLIQSVMDYNREQSGQTGTLYRLENKAHRLALSNFWSDLHLMAMAGISSLSIPMSQAHTGMSHRYDTELKGLSPRISIGINYHFSRLDKNLLAELMVGWQPITASRDFEMCFVGTSGGFTDYRPASAKVEMQLFEAELGLSYRFLSNARVQPLLRGGAILCHAFDGELTGKITNATGDWQEVTDHYFETKFVNHVHENGYHIGFYAGAGIAVPLHRGTLLLYADYTRHNLLQLKPLSLRLGYEF